MPWAVPVGIAVAESMAAAAASMAVSQLVKAMQGSPSQPGRTQSVKQAVAARRVIYGKCLVGGVPTFLHVSAAPDHPNQYMCSVHTLCGHPINSLVSINLDGSPVTWGGWNINPRMPLFYQEAGKYHGQIWYDKKLGLPAEPAFPGMVAITTRDGSNLWTADHRQDGCASVAMVFSWNSDIFPTGIPNISFVVQGKKLYDLRDSSTAYTANAALAIYDFLTNKEYGLGADSSEVNAASVIAAANICDESVSLKAGGSEKRYEINGMFSVDVPPTEILTELARAMAGTVVFSQGQWYLNPGIWRSPSITLTDDDMRAPLQAQTLRPKRELCNAVQGTFYAAALTGTSNYQKCNFPSVVHPEHLCDDSGYPNATQTGDWTVSTAYAIDDAVIDASPRSVLGVWAPSTAYVVNDYVRDTTTGGVYICISNHTSSAAGSGGNEPGVGSSWNTKWGDVSTTYSDFRGGIYVCTTAHTSSALDEPGIGASWHTYWTEMTGYIWKDLELNFTTSCPMAQRIAKIALEVARHQTTAVLKCKLSAFQLQPGDTFYYKHARFGWNPATLQVLQSDFVMEDQDGTPALGIDVKAQVVDASIYAWDQNAEEQALGQPSQPTSPDTEIPRPTPAAYGPGVTWTTATTSIEFTWDYTGGNAIILLDQENTQYTPSGNQNCTGLTANTAYKFYPAYNRNIDAFTGIMSDGVGTPAWLETVSTDPNVNRARIAEWQRAGNITLALNPISISTPSSGTGGGGGGGDGGCLEVGMFVKELKRGVIRCQNVAVGDSLWSETGWLKVFEVGRRLHDLWTELRFNNGAAITVTTGHPFTLVDSSMKKASQLSLDDQIPTPTGLCFPISITFAKRMSEKISIRLEVPHTFYASADGKQWVLTHNINYLTT